MKSSTNNLSAITPPSLAATASTTHAAAASTTHAATASTTLAATASTSSATASTTSVITPPTTTALIMCAGVGARAKLSYNKILHYIGHQTIIEMTVAKFAGIVDEIIIVASSSDTEAIRQLVGEQTKIVTGGATRSESVKNGLACVETDIVLIHDGARPFVSCDIIYSSIASAIKYGSGIVAVPAVDTMKTVEGEVVTSTLDRNKLYNIQTPQTFRTNEIVRAYALCDLSRNNLTDDSSVFEMAGNSAHIVIGSYDNIKITTDSDIAKIHSPNIYIGVGFDVHQLVANRKLILGGVEIEYHLGLLGHSDADVITHSIMDALLSAASLPDIGVLFPDNDNTYKNIDSLLLLAKVNEQLIKQNKRIKNISAVIMAQSPKLAKYIPLMREKLARTLNISCEQINISATTTEKLGIIGENKGMASSSSCLLEKSESK